MSPADRLGVVQRGGDQVIEVDRLDVEGLPHMGAAVAQDLHHLGSVLDRIEMGLDRLRRSRDFAQRQRSRKNFDENQVHGRARAQPSSRDTTRGIASITIRSLQKDFLWVFGCRHP